MRFKRSKADACLYFKWTSKDLVVFISWANDLLCCGATELVQEAKKALSMNWEN
jgi:hypothetical protein